MTVQVPFRGRSVRLVGPRSALEKVVLEELVSALTELTKQNGAIPDIVTVSEAEP